MTEYYLAVDIGASSGRHILGWRKEDGKLCLEEIYRFPNRLVNREGHLCWELDRLFEEIKNGMKRCKEVGKIPVSMGIDTWGVDFVLLDREDRILGDTIAYRDSRTDGMDEAVSKTISLSALYARTGIQKQPFNSIYQLEAVKQKNPEFLEQAAAFLMVPDYFHFLLTGKKTPEYTNATTTQMVSPVTKDWDYELITRLGLPEQLFLPLSMPGTEAGSLTKEIREEVGFCCRVVLPPTHDTASAVLSVPCEGEDSIYISSGTWSLMGIERRKADCGAESRVHNFTNEGGYAYRFRYLKNIMGLWMLQSMRRELTEPMSFDEIEQAARSEWEFPSRVDCNDNCFLVPESMTEAVREFCRRTGQQVPETTGEIAAVIYNSLAVCYRETAEEIEAITGRKFSRIHIVGGGSMDGYLNRLTAKQTGKTVYAGPTESTALGNLLAQMLAAGSFKSVEQARNAVRNSFEIKEFKA